ncbi:MAG TPA: archease [Bacteroidota bacterium]|nr:archease [Bacteroidota bacterium]
MQPSYRILEHPADLGIEAEADTLEETFAFAARALMSVIVEPDSVTAREWRRLAVPGGDPEQLLVRWLGEILYLFDGAGFVSGEFRIAPITGSGLEATVGGEPAGGSSLRMKLDVKAVTYHDISVRRTSRGWYARAYLDI